VSTKTYEEFCEWQNNVEENFGDDYLDSPSLSRVIDWN
jgi:hypothetical protein